MIRIENMVFTTVARKLRDTFSDKDLYIVGEYHNVPTHFPAISIEEVSNTTATSYIDSSRTEKYAEVVYDINIYSNLMNGRKQETKDIADIADKVMVEELGFRRTISTPTPYEDDTIYRFTNRYQATVSNENTIYR